MASLLQYNICGTPSVKLTWKHAIETRQCYIANRVQRISLFWHLTLSFETRMKARVGEGLLGERG